MQLEPQSSIFDLIVTVAIVLGALSLLYIIAMVIIMMAPKTPNKGTILAFFGGPLAYIYVGKWGKAIGLYLLVWITSGIAILFLWPYSMVNIRTNVRTYLEDQVIRQSNLQKVGLEVQKLKYEVNNSQIDKEERMPVPPPSPVLSPESSAIPTQKQYTLSLKVSGEGKTVPAEGVRQFKEGTVVYVNASPSENWRFAGWIGAVEDPYSPETSVDVSSDKIVTATFLPSE
jgi:hypothetical protein